MGGLTMYTMYFNAFIDKDKLITETKNYWCKGTPLISRSLVIIQVSLSTLEPPCALLLKSLNWQLH